MRPQGIAREVEQLDRLDRKGKARSLPPAESELRRKRLAQQGDSRRLGQLVESLDQQVVMFRQNEQGGGQERSWF